MCFKSCLLYLLFIHSLIIPTFCCCVNFFFVSFTHAPAKFNASSSLSNIALNADLFMPLLINLIAYATFWNCLKPLSVSMQFLKYTSNIGCLSVFTSGRVSKYVFICFSCIISPIPAFFLKFLAFSLNPLDKHRHTNHNRFQFFALCTLSTFPSVL